MPTSSALRKKASSFMCCDKAAGSSGSGAFCFATIPSTMSLKNTCICPKAPETGCFITNRGRCSFRYGPKSPRAALFPLPAIRAPSGRNGAGPAAPKAPSAPRPPPAHGGGAPRAQRGRDTGDAQWYINLVDNDRYDHTYTVFAKVVSGMDVVDGILEGDVVQEVRIVASRQDGKK